MASPRPKSAYVLHGSERRVPVRALSRGPDGSALLARLEPSGALIELRHATVASTDPARWRRIDQWAQVYALLPQPGFRRLEAREEIEGCPVFVLGDYSARVLRTQLAPGVIADADAWPLFGALARALESAHQLGYVHGAIGPSAVTLREDGAPQLDFAWLDVGGHDSEVDRLCRAPEAELDAASDVYSFGALLRLALRGPAAISGTISRFDPLIGELTRPDPESRPRMAEVCRAWDALAPARAPGMALQPTLLSFPPESSPTQRIVTRELAPGQRLGRFELLRKIGEGGMGEVYRAIDRASGQEAALKLLRDDAGNDAARRRRFRKEARILQEVDHPNVAKLIEWNRDGALDFIALEFIDGGDLMELLEQRGGRLPEREALSMMADVCQGLREAHARGIVHRDIKPQNVMIARPQAGHAPDAPLVIKLCDFGIARVLEGQTGTLAFTEETTLLGTPDFMAPEQAAGGSITPATDVYALGVTLFLLISGRLPFPASETVAKLVAHASQVAPPLAGVAPDTSDATCALVARMLDKDASQRFVDAGALLEAIQRILHGAAGSAALHPQLPAADPERLVRIAFEWDLRAQPEALWPYVSNTDRMNRAVGLPPTLFARTADSGELRGRNRVLGVELDWREHPFEWIESKRWAILRVFQGGMMSWYTVALELTRKSEGGTLLRYSMTSEPRNMVARWLLDFELRVKQRAALARLFERIDAHACEHGERVPGRDPFETPRPLDAAQRLALDRGLAKLREEGVPGEVIEALAAFCELSGDQQVAQLRPLAFARAHGLDPELVVDACLRAAHCGLFTLLWEVLCPLCRVPADFADSLRALAEHGHCPSCNQDFALDFAQSLELVFRVAPDVRKSELRTYCVGGPAFAPHVVAQLRLQPGERLALELVLGHGSYKVRSPQLPYAFPLQISGSAHSHRSSLRFTAAAPSPARIALAAGGQWLEVENALERELVVRVERAAPREDALTAARAACLASFRKLFPGEVLASGRLVAVGRTAFLLAAVHGQRRLIQELGDARAFELLLERLHEIDDAVAAEGGAVVKTASGSTLCAFDDAASACRAALALHYRLQADDTVRLVVHQGSAVTATIDGRLDYFGQSVESALDLLAHAPSRRILLSSVIADDPGVMAELTDAGHQLNLLDFEDESGWGVAVAPRERDG